ncbi:MAG TPA: PSD1 and planctomycete cytochrome C domain-containing protein [Pirellulaceae bacterium]|jgi:mono/diheme cytochrome c family protein
MQLGFLKIFAVLAGGLLFAQQVVADIPDKVKFNQDVRPILSGNCFYCHGPDPKHREADLRLDNREGATADLGGYAAIVPGKPDQSTLIKRVTSTDPDERMPPPASKKPHLTDDQIAILRRWIEQGAEYEGHWAFLPLAPVQPPVVKNESWAQNPIDRFILSRLEQDGISPSPEADAATRIRRVSLDLTGLLPTPEEVEAFRSGKETYTALVERLLSSPHFGERWGRHWLDQARYADSNGYSIDSERQMWPYRDWVIKALNDDMPFDQFTIEQLAGDLLPKPTKSQLVATAFHRNTLINEEGGTDKEQFRHEAVVDRVNTTGAVWLGLTVGCCQCHTHKFDPIQHREYYELFAFFNNGTDINNRGATIPVTRGEIFGRPVTPPQPSAPTPEQLAAWEKEELARLEKLDAQQDAADAQWKPVQYVEYGTESNAGFDLLSDNSLLSDNKGSDNDTYRVVVKTGLQQIAAVRLRTLTHPSLPRKGPGRAGNGNFVLTDFTVSLAGKELDFKTAYTDHEQPSFPATAAIDDDSKSGWAINVGYGQTAKLNDDHEAVFLFEKPVEIEAGQPLEIKLFHNANADYLIGRFALDVIDKTPAKPVAIDEPLLAALRLPSDKRSREQSLLVSDSFTKAEAAGKSGRGRRGGGSPDIADLMVWKELDKPRETYVCLRGDFLRPDKETGPLVPDVLDAVPPKLAPSEKRNRLDLAKWLVSPENPLTPRVQMNRVWMHYFGRGLVETEEDFGTQGSPPTHPELLDWLAAEFIRQKWSLKEMHRLIVTSNTYRQSSNFRADLKDKDPRNLLLARQERVRFDAEIVRDAALSASGLLDPTIGGPSVKPPQPEGVYAFTQTQKKWAADTGPARFRRGMYTLFFRSAPHPLFTTFDAPDFQTVCTRRGRSNTPLQALTVANDEAFVELAQGLAARVMRALPSANLETRLRRAYLLTLCREPSASELGTLHGFYDRQLADLKDEADRAKALLSADLAAENDPFGPAALVLVCRAILNTDAFITRE